MAVNIFDLKDNVSFRPARELMACMQRTSFPWCHKAGYMMLPYERLQVMGYPMYRQVYSGPYKCPFASAVKQVNSNGVAHVTGNGVHLAVFGAGFTYSLLKLLRRHDTEANVVLS